MQLFRKKRKNTNIDYNTYDKNWYFSFLDEWDDMPRPEKMLKKNQLNYLYRLSLRVKANEGYRDLKLLNEEEINSFWSKVKSNLDYVDPVNILEFQHFFSLPFKAYLLRLKGCGQQTEYTKTDVVARLDTGELITKASDQKIHIEMMSFDKPENRLTIIGYLDDLPFEKDTPSVCVYINGTKKRLNHSGLYSDYKVFGKTIYSRFPFRIDIDIDRQVPLEISFTLQNKATSTIVPLGLSFDRVMSKLSNKNSYWRFHNYMATHNHRMLFIRSTSTFITFTREIIWLLYIGVFKFRLRAMGLRVLYWLTMPLHSNKNIWMYADKIYKGNDNAEWLFRYAIKQNDDAHHFYTLDKKSPDRKRFEKNGIKYLKYKSLKQRLLFLHANIVVFTYANAPAYYRFGGINEVFFRDLFDYDIMYLQHGLAVQDTSWNYNKSIDDIKLFFVASKFETENLLRPNFGYKPSEIVKAGATRYDGLINNAKKNILIAPTWRSYLVPLGKDYGESHGPSKLFENTDYYKIYHALATDERLMSSARKLGYSISFLLHPDMSSQANKFSSNDCVEILPAASGLDYFKVLTEANLMITDYSGVQFDFAYMYKPVVYFQPEEIPSHYDEATYRYKDHALGEITTKLDELIKLTCEYMENGCELKPKYRKRIDDFFYHHDRNNSKRTYDEIVKWQNRA